MADLPNFFFRQRVLEDNLDDAFAGLEFADQDLIADVEFGQQASLVGVSVSDITDPSLAAANKYSLLGGIHNGLKCGYTPAPSPGLPHTDLKVVVSAGTAHDDRGRRIVVGIRHDPTTGRFTTPNPTFVVDCAAAGLTPVGEGGSASGGATVTPPSGQTRWITVGVVYDRLLLTPRVDGNAATVFYDRIESFRFTVKAGASTAGVPAPAPPDPDVIILGDFLVNSAGHIIEQDFKRRGDWIRTTIGASGAPIDTYLVPSENGTDASHFVEGNVRKAILRILRQTGGVAGDLAGHTSQSAPTQRHHAKNIDVSKTTATWANGEIFPINYTGPAYSDPILGGGTNNDGVQFFLNKLVERLGNFSTVNDQPDGIEVIGARPISTLLPELQSPTPMEWAGGSFGALAYKMFQAINNRGIINGVNSWSAFNYFTNQVVCQTLTGNESLPQITHTADLLEIPASQKVVVQQMLGSTGDCGSILMEADASGLGHAITIANNCFWDNIASQWQAYSTLLPATRTVFAPGGVVVFNRADTSDVWNDNPDDVFGWNKSTKLTFGSGTSASNLYIDPDILPGAGLLTNVAQSMVIGWDGFHPSGASGTIGGSINYRFAYQVPPASITVGSAITTNSNIGTTPSFVNIRANDAFWSVTPTAANAHTRVHRPITINP